MSVDGDEGRRVRLVLGALADSFLAATRSTTAVICIGATCSEPFRVRDVPVATPGRARLGDLARAVVDELPERGTRLLHVGGYELQLRPRMVLLDGDPVAIAPAPAAILRKLAESPGAVFSRAQLLQSLPGQATADEHTVETAVARLRSSLGPAADIVRTVVKRGYRLDLDPA